VSEPQRGCFWPELQEGRRLTHELPREQEQAVAAVSPDQRAQINHTLSNLNVACFSSNRRYVSREDMPGRWGGTLSRACESAEPFLAYGDLQPGGTPIWTDLRAFAADASTHSCSCDRWSRRWARRLG
jgi:hypothetical protein